MDQVTVLQWNLKSVRRRKHELLHLINKFRPSVIAISETWLVPGSHFRVSGYSCLRADRADGYAGCALLVRRSLPFSLVSLPPISPDINIVAVEVFKIIFMSVYIPHPHSNMIPDISAVVSSIPSPIILMGDFNAHHMSWGSSHNDLFGLALLELFDDVNLCIVNDGSPTRRVYPSQNPRSAVDITVCSPVLASVISWGVLSFSYGSDHFPIVFSIPNRVTPAHNFSSTLKFKLSGLSDDKWSSYSSTLDGKLNSLSVSMNTDLSSLIEAYSMFVECVISSAEENFPLKKPFKYIVSTPWWDAECTEVIRERKRAEEDYNSAMSRGNFINYQRIAAKATKLLLRKKRDGWVRYCESLSPSTPSCLVWRQIRRYRGACSSRDISVNDPYSWLEGFSDKMSPPYVPYVDSFPSPPLSIPSVGSFDSAFSFYELELALDGLSDSSPGIDGIPYSFLKNASSNSKQFYLDLVNKFFNLGFVPQFWKNQIVIPIVKPGKNPSDPNSYRPIALSSVLAKVLEHMIKHRLEWFVESKNLLAKSQFGFRKGMSTMDSLSILTTDIRISLLKKEYLVGVFLDIASAYDNVLLPVLRNKLAFIGIPEKLVRFIFNLLTERSVTIKTQYSLLPPRTVWKGLPQGSVLSPLLYSLYTSDLELSVQSFCQILQYADDIALYISDKYLATASNRLSSALGYLSDWLLRHGLSLSAAKSSVVVFSGKRIVPPVFVSVHNEVIPQDNKVKFLGVWLDNKLSGLVHFDFVSQKCEKNINILRSLSGVWWGAHPYSQKMLYNAIVRSHIDYGSFLLDPCSKSGHKIIDRIQSKCLRIILGAMKSSPINAMQVECVDPPLGHRRQFLSNRFFFKLVQNSAHPLLHKLANLSSLYESLSRSRPSLEMSALVQSYLQFTRLPHPLFQSQCLPLYSTPYEALTFSPNIILDFGIDKGTVEASRSFSNIRQTEFRNWFEFYADASKCPDNPVGAAVWIPSFRIILAYKCPAVYSVFTGEAVAILEAIKFIKSHSINNSIIFSDSKSCLQSILSNPFRSKTKFPIILSIREHLFQCDRLGINIAIAWIPGHSGIPGNESADSCAKSAASTGSLEHSHIYFHDVCSTFEPALFKSWSSDWQISRSIKGKFFGDIQPEIPYKPWFSKFKKADKRTTSVVCRLRLNHSCTPVFLSKLRIRDSSLCECGLDQGNVDHIFFSCPKLQFSLYDVMPPNIPRPTSFKCLLSLVFSPFISILCKFIQVNKIKL